MGLPVGIHFRTFLVELSGCHGLVVGHLWCGIHGALACVENEWICLRGYLEILPGNWNVFFSDPENPASGDHQISDLSGLRIHHEVVDAAQSVVLRRPHVCPEQLVGPEGIAVVRHRLRTRDLFLSPARFPYPRRFTAMQIGHVEGVDIFGCREHILARLLLPVSGENVRGGNERSYLISGTCIWVTAHGSRWIWTHFISITISRVANWITVRIAGPRQPVAVLLHLTVEGAE